MCFCRPKSVFRGYCIKNDKDGIQIQVYNINNESVIHYSQCISVKVKKNLRKSQAQFRERLRKLRLRQNNGFLIKIRVHHRQVGKEILDLSDHMGKKLTPFTEDVVTIKKRIFFIRNTYTAISGVSYLHNDKIAKVGANSNTGY